MLTKRVLILGIEEGIVLAAIPSLMPELQGRQR
jgi:hypothetical protein